MSKGRNSRFNADILNEKDENGDIISAWCMPGKNSEEGVCFVCNTVISCRQHGVTAIKRHANGKKHKEMCSKLRTNGSLKITQAKLVTNSSSTLSTISHADEILRAETYFVFSLAHCNVPFSYGDHMTKLFPKMFTDSKIAAEFNMNRKKISYTISDGIGPYIKSELLNDIIKSNAFYSVQVDETPIGDKRSNQFDILIRYFSDTHQQIVSHHFESFLMGHTKAVNLFEAIESSLAELPKVKLLSFFSDGPNLMKSVKKKIGNLNQDLLDIGECSLHKVHNAFGHGIEVFDASFELLLVDLYYFFKRSPVQFEDFKKEQSTLGLPDHVFLRHLSSRWLTLHSATIRFIEQYEAVQVFFKRDISTRNEGQRIKRIKATLADKTVLAKALFLKNVGDLFTSFLTLFQKDEPLVHILYDEVLNLIKKIMGRFLRKEVFLNKPGGELKLLDVSKGEHWLKQPEIGLDTQKELLKNCKDQSQNFYKAARSFYITSTKSLLKSLPLNNKFLENLKCLHPLYRLEANSVCLVRMLASEVPQVIEASEVSSLTDEWTLLQTEDLASDQNQRIDKYWNVIFQIKDSQNNVKYVKISRLVKALLALAHGNAECERGFSENKHLLEGRPLLSLESINGIRQIKSYLKMCDDNLNGLKINKELLLKVKHAGTNYRKRLELSKSSKRKLQEVEAEEVDLKKEEMELGKQLAASQKMLNRAEGIISDGLNKSDLSEIKNGQVLLKESKDNIEKYLKKLEENRMLQLKKTQNKKTKG